MSHTPVTVKKHKRKTFSPTATAVVHEHTHAPTAASHEHTHAPTIYPTARFDHTRTPTATIHHQHTHTPNLDEAVSDVPPPPLIPVNATLFMDELNHTDPPVPMPSEGTLLYSSGSSSSTLNPGVYVGAMFLLPMVVLGAWIVQGRVRRRHYDPIPDDDFP
jgi:hypothetical protein